MTPQLKTAATQSVESILADVRMESEHDFYLHDSGSFHTPSGFHRSISREFQEFVGLKSAETTEKYFRFIRDYLTFRIDGEDGLPALFTESCVDAQKRQKAYYRSRGWKLDTPRPFDQAIATHPPRVSYEKFRRLAVNKLYDILFAAGAREDNPAYCDGWLSANLQTRTSAAHLVSNNEFQARQAGRKFLPPALSETTSIPVEPEECAAQLAEDLDLVCAPQDVKDFDDILEANGCRPFSVSTASLYGWVMAGMEDEVLARNKGRGDKLDVTLVLPPAVLLNLRSRLSSSPSPLLRCRTLLEEVELCSDEIASGKDTGEAEEFLKALPLILCEKTGMARSYEGARYYYRKGREARLNRAAGSSPEVGSAANPATRFTTGRRQPVMSDHRRCSITRQVRDVLQSTSDEQQRKARIEVIAANHGQSSDQSKRYAAAAYLEEDRHRLREDLKFKRERLNELRTRSPAPLQSDEAHLETAREQAAFLARRPD